MSTWNRERVLHINKLSRPRPLVLDYPDTCWNLKQTNRVLAEALKHGTWILQYLLIIQSPFGPFPAFILGLANSNKCYLISPPIGVVKTTKIPTGINSYNFNFVKTGGVFLHGSSKLNYFWRLNWFDGLNHLFDLFLIISWIVLLSLFLFFFLVIFPFPTFSH